MGVELAQDVRDVAHRGSGTDVQPFRDLPVRKPLDQEAQHLKFALCQSGGGGPVLGGNEVQALRQADLLVADLDVPASSRNGRIAASGRIASRSWGVRRRARSTSSAVRPDALPEQHSGASATTTQAWS